MRSRSHQTNPPAGLSVVASLATFIAALMIAVALAAPAYGTEPEEAATWRFAPASAPPAPAGAEPAGYPVPLGKVGQISFWTPNRGLLITGGSGESCAASATAVVPCGLYAYNGRSWHLLSNVCGGANGRIAWAGPDEFWTIADQRPSQLSAGSAYGNVSLCHFLNGQVVASYAMPLNQPDSYQPMDAAACISPENCWFGGALVKSASGGGFHLHWNGQELTVVYSPEGHAIASMALASAGVLFESVQLNPSDSYSLESPARPTVLHQIDPPGSSVEFHNLFIPDSSCQTLEFCPPLPEYGAAAPDAYAGFSLSSDYTPSGANQHAPQLWAVAGASGVESPSPAHPIALRFSEGTWSQVAGGEGSGRNEPFTYTSKAAGGETTVEETPIGVAAEPGSPAAWVTIESHDGQAHVDYLTATGSISERDVLGTAQGVGKRGNARAIACPAANDCWLATDQGWLFHLANHATETLPQDTDANFAGVITVRPPDGGVPQLPPIEPPPDDSLANQLPPPPPPSTATVQPPARMSKPPYTDVHTRLVHRYTLELSFSLTVKSHVQLTAQHGHRRVARSPRETLKAGPHALMLHLNPHEWPNKLDLKVTPLEALPTVLATGGGQTKGATNGSTPPPLSENSVST
jgi:hypothetical protein